jgi:diguanylate cyclase (GGDEF)-like protein
MAAPVDPALNLRFHGNGAGAAPGPVVQRVPFPSLQRGSARALVIGLLAAVIGGGILLAARAMDVDREVHRRYDHAHPFVELALETSQLGAQLHELQAASVRAGAILSSARTTLLDDVARLETALKRVRELDPTAEERAVARELDRVAVSIRSTLQDMTGHTPQRPPGTATLPAALVEQAEAIERLMPRLTAMARARTAQAARDAEAFLSASRIAVVGFAVLTVVLAAVLSFLTLRALQANRELLHRLEQNALKDPLTGTVNRRGLDEALPHERARAARSGEPLTVVMIDLDHFKRYNDRQGHAGGDALLRAAAQGWLKHLRPTDMLARYGGEEFTLVLPACGSDQATALVSRLRSVMPDRQTFSAGIATWNGTETTDELVQRADAALLKAKRAGRNRTLVAVVEPQGTLPLAGAAG